MILLSVCAIFIVGFLSACYIYIKHIYSYWRNCGVGYVEPSFPYGNLKTLKQDEHIAFITQTLYTRLKGCGPFGGAYFFTEPVLIPTDLNFVNNILIKDFNYFEDRGFFYNEKHDPISAHLFAVPTEKWKLLRKKLSPTFTSGKMKSMFPKIVDISGRFRPMMKQCLIKSNDIDIKDVLVRYTTDVIGCCAFGVECNSLADPNAEFRAQTRKIFDVPFDSEMGRMFNAIYPKLATFLGRKVVESGVSQFFHSVVQQTVEHREKNKIKAYDFMHLLIQLKNFGKLSDSESLEIEKLTMAEITSQSFLFFIAGFETSSITLLYSLYELAQNRGLQDKVREEITHVLNKYNGEITYEAIHEMNLLDRIVKETLRKYPALPYLQRVCIEDYHVPNTDSIIEKGTYIFIPTYGIHHDPEIYPVPEKYDPDRFLPENEKNRHPMSYLAFGDGPRNCIGMRFGRMQTRVGLARLLHDYKFDVCSKTPKKIKFQSDNVVMAPQTDVYLNVVPLK